MLNEMIDMHEVSPQIRKSMRRLPGPHHYQIGEKLPQKVTGTDAQTSSSWT
jgi:hypothetical protein